MKKILIGFIAIGLLTLVGCEKDDTDSADGTTDDSSIQYGEGATDIDGNTYQSVIIGEQEWMAENLRTTKYSDGTSIPNLIDLTELDPNRIEEWANDTTGAWCNYLNDNQYDTIYGKLYNWYAVETGKLCPTGWHVPTDAEWTVLEDYLKTNGHEWAEGTALKSTSGWSGSGNGTDDYGWNGLPGGVRFGNGNFYGIVGNGLWWSYSVDVPFKYRHLSYDKDASFTASAPFERNGFSVRCLRD